MASYNPDEELEYLRRENDKLKENITKAWHIINMLEEKDISPEIKAAIKTWKFKQAKA